MTTRNEKISQAIEAKEAAKKSCAEVIRAVQQECEHPLILERSSGVTEYCFIENRWIPPVRICAACGYVEEVRYGWPGRTTDTPLYNSNPKGQSVLNRVDFNIDNARLTAELIVQHHS